MTLIRWARKGLLTGKPGGRGRSCSFSSVDVETAFLIAELRQRCRVPLSAIPRILKAIPPNSSGYLVLAPSLVPFGHVVVRTPGKVIEVFKRAGASGLFVVEYGKRG